MALVNIDSARQQVLRALARMEPPQGIELMSYKRNRTIAVVCRQDGGYLVRERGYVEQEMEVAEEGLSRLLKTLIRREFPRSRKVRLHRFAHPDELERPHQKI